MALLGFQDYLDVHSSRLKFTGKGLDLVDATATKPIHFLVLICPPFICPGCCSIPCTFHACTYVYSLGTGKGTQDAGRHPVCFCLELATHSLRWDSAHTLQCVNFCNTWKALYTLAMYCANRIGLLIYV